MTPWPMLFWPRRSWQTITKGEGGTSWITGEMKRKFHPSISSISFEALSKLKQSHIKIYFCIFLDCSQINIYLPYDFNFSKPTSQNRHKADCKYNCVHLKQIHQHIRVKSSSTINRLLCPWTGLISQRGSSWKWQGWGTFSGSLDPSRSRSSATWWRRRPSSLLTPAPRPHRARSPEPASNF